MGRVGAVQGCISSKRA